MPDEPNRETPQIARLSAPQTGPASLDAPSVAKRLRLSGAAPWCVGLGAVLLGVAGGKPLPGLLMGLVSGGLVAVRVRSQRVTSSDHSAQRLMLLLPLSLMMAPSLLAGTPSLSRVVLDLLLYGLAGVMLGSGRVTGCLFGPVLGALATVDKTGVPAQAGVPSTDRHDRGCDIAAGVVLLLYWLVNLGLITRAFLTLGERFMPQDTAYFEQCLWGLTQGRNFLMGSSQQWWVYDPPLTSHFAMHFSPMLLGVAGIYALLPSFHVLHAVQGLAITLSALPFYLAWRPSFRPAGLAWMLAYLLSATVISQTWLSFHELALAAPCVSFAAYAFLTQRFRLYFVSLLLAMAVREDLALLAIMAGMSAMLLSRSRDFRRWGLLPILSGVLWWIGAGKLMAFMGASGGQVILGLFSRFGHTPGEIVVTMVGSPALVLGMLLEDHRLSYVLEELRTGGFGALASPLNVWVWPAMAVNLLVRGAGTAWPDVHYSVYLPAVLMMGALGFWQKAGRWLAARLMLDMREAHLSLAVCLLPLVLMGLPDVVSTRVNAWKGSPDGPEALEMVQAIPAEASVAAPRHVTPFLAKRERLYIVNRRQAYSFYDPEYVMVEQNPGQSGLSDGTLEPYAAYVEKLRHDDAFELVKEGQYYRLYREREHVTRALPFVRRASAGVP